MATDSRFPSRLFTTPNALQCSHEGDVDANPRVVQLISAAAARLKDDDVYLPKPPQPLVSTYSMESDTDGDLIYYADSRGSFATTTSQSFESTPVLPRSRLMSIADVGAPSLTTSEPDSVAYASTLTTSESDSVSTLTTSEPDYTARAMLRDGSGSPTAGTPRRRSGSSWLQQAPPVAADSVTGVLCRVWATALDRPANAPPVQPTDDFFELGGHVRLACRAVSIIRAIMSGEATIPVDLDTFYSHPTPAALSAALGPAVTLRVDSWPTEPVLLTKKAATTPAADPAAERVYPASRAQQRMWLLQQQRPSAYDLNVPAFFSVRAAGHRASAAISAEQGAAANGSATPAEAYVTAAHVLEAALDVVRRHESLRTTFRMGPGGELLQVVRPLDEAAKWDFFQTFDLRGVPEEKQEARLRAIRDEFARTRFDLENGPLVAGFYAELDRHGRGCLGWVAHHSVFDGTSGALVVREIMLQAGGYEVPEPQVQYADFSQWQLEQLSSGSMEEHLAYWQSKLSDLPRLELPYDHPRLPADGASRGHEMRGASIGFSWPPGLSSRVATLARRHGVSVYVVLASAYASVLQRWSGGAQEVPVGTVMAGRPLPSFDSVCGMFVNTAVLRVPVAADRPFGELLREVQRTLLQAFEHHDAPFEEVVRRVDTNREPGRHPLCDVLFVYQSGSSAPFFDEQTVGSRSTARLVDPSDPAVDPASANPSRLSTHLTRQYWHGDVCQLDAGLTMWRKAGCLGGSLEYDSSLFDEATMRRMLDHLRATLEFVVGDASRAVGSIPMLSQAELTQLRTFEVTTAPAGQAQCLHDMFEAQASLTPDAVALDFESTRTLTYAELSRQSTQLARHLRNLGVGLESVVGLYADKSIEAYVAIMAVLKAGGCYVPLDPEHPPERTQFMLEDSKSNIVLTQSALITKLRQAITTPDGTLAGVHLVALDAADAVWRSERDEPLGDVGVRPENLAYVIYTSGTTGRPKGCMLEHRQLYNRSVKPEVWAGPGDRYFAFLALVFDPSVDDIRYAFTYGGTLCCASRSTMLEDAPGILRRMRATHVTLTPSLLASLGDSELPELRVMVVGGEQMTSVLVSEWSDRVSLYNVYGPTENTIASTRLLCKTTSSPSNIGRPFANVSAYILNEQLVQLPVGCVGELYLGGSQVARGYLNRPDLTAARFIADPFRPFDPAARLYKSGDLARWMPDGTLECLGRRDGQVKLRGNRIELGEIESVLLEVAAVSRAAVLVQTLGGPADAKVQALVAYVVAQPDASADASAPADSAALVSAVLAHCRTRLASYMVPSYVLVLDELPLTTSGKLDTRALPLPELSAASADHSPAGADGSAATSAAGRQPGTPLESALWGVLRQVLPLAPGVDDDFFALGGHSLLAMQLVGKVRSRYGSRVPLTLQIVFEHKTVAKMAAALAESGVQLASSDETDTVRAAAATLSDDDVVVNASDEGADALSEPIPPTDARASDGEGFSCPASSGQMRLWLIQQNEPESNAYNVPVFFRISGSASTRPSVTVDRLQRYASELVRRHEVLRTTYAMGPDGSLLQVVHGVHSEQAVAAARVAVTALTDDRKDGEDAAQQWAEREYRRAFDLTDGPVVRFCALTADARTDAVPTHFGMVAHHAALDGWSCALLCAELERMWRHDDDVIGASSVLSLGTGLPASASVSSATLPPVAAQYADFSEWRRRRETSDAERLDSSAAYWRRQLSGVEALELPLDRPRPTDGSPSPCGHVKISWSAKLVSRLEALAQSSNSSLFMVVAAGLTAMLHRWNADGADVSIGAVLTGRSDSRLEPTIGFFANTVVLRTILGSSMPFAELLRRVRTNALDAIEHQDVPFDRVVRESGAERRVGRNPLFDVLLVYQQFDGSDRLQRVDLGNGAALEAMEVLPSTAKADLVIDVWRRESSMTMVLEYATAIWNESTVRRMGSHIKRLLKGVARAADALSAAAALVGPEAPVGKLPMLGRSEIAQIEKWSMDAEDFGQPMCAHEIFEAQARRTPDAIAIDFEGTHSLTYAELSRRSTQLARELQRFGVGLESLVGLYLDKSIEAYTGILSVLKAGGCYVPLDPEHPPERTQFMLEDSAARLVITSSTYVEKLKLAIAGIASPPHLLVLDQVARWDEWDASPLGDVGVRPHHLCYGIFTSGTTGRPKGVMQQHDMLFNELMHDRPVLNLKPGTRWFAFASLTFDVSVHDFFMPTSIGGTVCCARKQVMLDNLPGLINQMKVNVLALTSSVALVLDPRKLPTVHTMLCAGEAMTNAVINTWCPHTRVINDYGPTEVFICTEAVCHVGSLTSSIGRPLRNVEVRILNEMREPAPIGSIGEIYFGGVQVARGYLNRPDLTAARFIANPFKPDAANSRLYMTGDLGRFLPDGTIECLGRRDGQVKLRGNRIELGEIESVLVEVPGVSRAAVVVQHLVAEGASGPGVPTLVAYVVMEGSAPEEDDVAAEAAGTSTPGAGTPAGSPSKVPSSGSPSANSPSSNPPSAASSPSANKVTARNLLAPDVHKALANQCRLRLAPYMVPSHFVRMDKLPLTSSGKLDTRSLPRPVVVSSRPSSPEAAGAEGLGASDAVPADAIEEAMCRISKELLQVPHVSPMDDFFELGGNSLLAFTLVTRLRENVPGLERISIRHLMQHHTMRGLKRDLVPDEVDESDDDGYEDDGLNHGDLSPRTLFADDDNHSAKSNRSDKSGRYGKSALGSKAASRVGSRARLSVKFSESMVSGPAAATAASPLAAVSDGELPEMQTMLLPELIRTPLQWAAMVSVVLVMCACGIPIVLYISNVTAYMGLVQLAFMLPLYLTSFGALLLTVSVIMKWMLLGRLQEGRYPLDSMFYVRYYTVQQIMFLTNGLAARLLVGSELINLWYRLLGVKIGTGSTMNTIGVTEWDLVEVGDHCYVGQEATLQPCTYEGRFLVLRRVVLGDRCTVGVRSHVFGGVVMEDGAELAPNSSVSRIRMGARTVWEGSAAELCVGRRAVEVEPWTTGERVAFTFYQFCFLGVILTVQSWALLSNWLIVRAYVVYVASVSYVLSAAFTFSYWLFPYGIVFTTLVATIKWILLGRNRAGERAYTPWLAARLWLLDTCLGSWAFQMFCEWFLNDGQTMCILMRMFGARIGSKAFLVAPRFQADIDMLEAGDGIVSGGQVFYYGRRRSGRTISFHPMRIQDNAVMGGRAVVLGGIDLGKGATLGECTAVNFPTADSSIYIGSPPTLLPSNTHARVQDPVMASVVLARSHPVLVPLAGIASALITPILVVAAAAPSAVIFWIAQEKFGSPLAFVVLPAVLLAFYLMLGLICLAVKRLVIGNFYGDWPIYSGFFLRWVFSSHVNRLRDNLVDRMLRGTPSYGPWLRLVGAKIGKRVHFDGVIPVEVDLLDIEDDAVIAGDVLILPHVIDSGELQFAKVHIGAGATIGPHCTLMPGAVVGENTQIHAGSIIMKREHVPANTAWTGNPLTFVAKLYPRPSSRASSRTVSRSPSSIVASTV